MISYRFLLYSTTILYDINVIVLTCMGMSALPDMYAMAGSPMAIGARIKGIHIRQSTHARVITVTLLALLKSAQILIASAHSTYILTDAHFDCGIFNDVGIMLCTL